MAGGIFISYRRDDSRHAAGRLIDSLGQTFKRHQLFMDVDSIEPGRDFVAELGSKVGSCNVLLAVIGPQWLDIRNEAGVRRLDDPSDFVRIELEAALSRNIRIVPVLIDGAKMPREADLPASLRPLARRNAIELRHERWGADAGRLVEVLAKDVRPARAGWLEALLARTISPSSDASHVPSTFARRLFMFGLVSGIASTIVLYTEKIWQRLDPIAKLVGMDSGLNLTIGLLFSAVLAACLYDSWGRRLATAAGTMIGVMVAWRTAIFVATTLADLLKAWPEGARLAAAGLVAGCVGAGLTYATVALSKRALFQSRGGWASVVAVGGLAGLLLADMDGKVLGITTLFLVWQPTVAFALGRAIDQAPQAASV